LRFDPAVEQLKCDHCGFVNPVPQLGPPVEEQDFNAALAATRDAQETQTIETVRCGSCAAEFTLDPNAESGLCPFCGSAVVRETTRAEQLKPKGVLPFKVTIDQAGEQFRTWLKRLWVAPTKLKQYARTDRSLLVILDGALALHKATRAVFGEAALIQRFFAITEEVHRQLDDHPLVLGDQLGAGQLLPGGAPLDKRRLSAADVRPTCDPRLFH
jgi:predicted RNA-binding Zn-ribbon protein involved in translation (DUF1610 family)